MLKQIACVLLSVVAVNSFAGCVDQPPPDQVHVTGGWVKASQCEGCIVEQTASPLSDTETIIVFDGEGREVCRTVTSRGIVLHDNCE